MGSPVPRLLTEVQVSVGRRGRRLRGNSGEKTTFRVMQVKSRSIPKAGHTRGQTTSPVRMPSLSVFLLLLHHRQGRG